MRWRDVVILAALLVAAFVLGRVTKMRTSGEHFIDRVDTLLVHDTTVRERPVFVDRWITRHDTAWLAVHDTTLLVDSVLVDVPIETRVYQEDSLYRAVVSGYRPSLDTLKVWNTTKEITRYVAVPERRPWGIGVQAGAGLGPQGLTPYVGVGISYNIIRF